MLSLRSEVEADRRRLSKNELKTKLADRFKSVAGKLMAFTLAITAALALVALPSEQASAAGKIAWGAATVSCSILNVRSSPSVDSAVIGQLGENTIVVIIEKTSNDEWFYINYNNLVGYSKAEYFKDILTAENFDAIGTVIAKDVRMRSKPGTEYDVLDILQTGEELKIIGINNGWYKVKVNGKTGYIRSDFVEIAGTGEEKKVYSTSTGNAIADFAIKFVGYDYVYGSTSPSVGFDCSGLVYYVYRQFGVTLTRTASGQWRDNGTKVDKSDMIPGDLVFFSSNGTGVTHVGIYIGNDQFVHASGKKVGVIISRLDSTYYTRCWWGAKRISLT